MGRRPDYALSRCLAELSTSFELAVLSIGKWPKPEEVFDVAPNAGQSLRLEDHKDHDHEPEQKELQAREENGWIAGQDVLEAINPVPQEDRQERDEGSAEQRAGNAPETADDNHRQVLATQRDAELR